MEDKVYCPRCGEDMTLKYDLSYYCQECVKEIKESNKKGYLNNEHDEV